MAIRTYAVCHTHRHGEDAFLIARDEGDHRLPPMAIDFAFHEPGTYEIERDDEFVTVETCGRELDAALNALREHDPESPELAELLRVHEAPPPACQTFERMIENGHKPGVIRAGRAPFHLVDRDLIGATAIEVEDRLYVRWTDSDGDEEFTCLKVGDVIGLEWEPRGLLPPPPDQGAGRRQ